MSSRHVCLPSHDFIQRTMTHAGLNLDLWCLVTLIRSLALLLPSLSPGACLSVREAEQLLVCREKREVEVDVGVQHVGKSEE